MPSAKRFCAPAAECPAPLPKKSNKYSFILQALFSRENAFVLLGADFWAFISYA